MEDGVQNPLRIVRVARYVLWNVQRPKYFHADNEPSPTPLHRIIRRRLL